MNKDALEECGRFLMVHLRDGALSHYDALAKGKWKAPGLQKLQKGLMGLSPSLRNVVRRAVVSSIDSAIHDFLFRVQEIADAGEKGGFEIRVLGKNVGKQSDGLHGEPYGKEGWQARYSSFGRAPDQA